MKHRIKPIQDKLSQLRRKLYLATPEWIRERDFEMFTAVLCFLAGVPLLITGQIEAGSMEEQLPMWVVRVWSGVLTFSPILVVLGVWRGHKFEATMSRAIPWLRTEASGLRLLSYAGYLYATIIAIVAQEDMGAAPFIVGIFALTCHSRAAYLTIKVEDYFILLETLRQAKEGM